MLKAASSRILAPAHLEPELVVSTEENYELLRTLVDNDPRSMRFFVGAGISKPPPSEMPLSADFQHKVLEELNRMTTEFYAPLQRLVAGDLAGRVDIERLPLETLLQFLKDVEGDDVLGVCDIYDSSPEKGLSNTCHRFLAAWLAQDYGPVVTVNIDHLIEDALPDGIRGSPGRIYADVTGFPQRAEPGRLYKLHGTVENRNTLRMTLDRVTPQLPPGAEQLFVTFLGDGPLCLVGWGGADLDLRPLITRGTRDHAHAVFLVIHAGGAARTEEEFRKRNPKAFEVIDLIGALPLFTSSERLFQALGEDVLGWPPSANPTARARDEGALWRPLSDWLESRQRNGRLEFLAGRTAGYVFFQLGLHQDARSIWSNTLGLTPDKSVRAGVRRDMAHALFRDHDIGGAIRENAEAMDEAIKAGDRLGQAQSLFGLGSVIVAWPLADPLSFLLAGHRLRTAARTFRQLGMELEAPVAKGQESRRRNEAVFGEAASLYWLGRWEQRLLAWLIPILRPVRNRLARRYMRARQLLEDDRINAVNELVNPLRSLALIRVYDDRDEAEGYAQAAVNLVRWTGDRQRLSTVMRDVAQLYLLSGRRSDLDVVRRRSDLDTAVRYWLGALLVASEGSGVSLADLAAGSTGSAALTFLNELRNMDPNRRLADVNGVSQTLYGLAETLSAIGGAGLAEAEEILHAAVPTVSRLPLPKRSKRVHLLRLRYLLLKVRLARLKSTAFR